ncbi:MAG: sulfotransferase [Deltaproteobacteria bacterium]|nr:sulfotransferase [Deltaproteobacteria bacterium]
MGKSDNKVTVAYIVGAGRSGSTVLDTILGNHSEVESVGELCNLVRSAWLGPDYCACGARGSECPFWSEVRLDWIRRTGASDLKEFKKLEDVFERSRFFSRLLRGSFARKAEFQVYSNYAVSLFQAISEVSGKRIIVDSSKIPARAFALSRMPGVDLKLIHLVRDPRGLARSLQKAFRKNLRSGVARDMRPFPVWRVPLPWIRVNVCSSWLVKRVGPGRGLTIRYEDLMADHRGTLEKLGKLMGLGYEPVIRTIDSGGSMKVGHTIAGNRVRMAGSIRLQADVEWVQKLSDREKALVRTLAGWHMRKYGY